MLDTPEPQAAGGRSARAEVASLRNDLGGLQSQLAGASQQLDAERSASAPPHPAAFSLLP